ncbi:hypothetical protein D8819_08565 [Streptococcus gordonii]|jgi:hypothetical protein|uniref:DUF443 family protein n=1 Tax=Streptococcus TaxID=1301 RepID=UPI000769F310|nr:MULTISPECIES: DUF443 family protein [Streptococcus]MBN2958875.1 DUF443 family protein [Streptococcus gordonii]MBS6244868.1 DUF443 family protein [Streptococcus sp.]RSJ40894.1 hypothetical protein D8819_08565 [Streptococcus gordonii]RSJ59509.1 hypothetical protein D8812_00525 [Streptococcus gordonii]RSK01241.1 hypothetical protein D8809_07615 [Streptococcus gordonii]
MTLEYNETSIFCHQLVEYDGKKFLLDASTMKPKLYYWGLPTKDITVEMMEVDKKVEIPGTRINKLNGTTAAIIVQPFVGVVNSQLKNLFREYAISQQIFLKLILFVVAMFISYLLFLFSRGKARKKVKNLFPTATKRYIVTFKPIPERKQIFDAHLLNVVLLACLAMYLFNNNGQEGIFLMIGGILMAFILTFEFGRVPVLLGAKTGNLRLDSVQEIR